MAFNQNASYGRAMLDAIASVVPAFGNILVVKNSSDTADRSYQQLQDIMTPDNAGRVRMFATLELAYAEAQDNNNDVILLDGHTAHSVAAMVTVAKNRVNFIGMDGGGRLSQQGAKVSIGVTGVATDLAPVLVTGIRNSFRNIKFTNDSTTNETLYGFIDAGEGTLIENCSFVKTTGLNDANHAHFYMAGDSLNMKNCTIGQSNSPSSAAGFGIKIAAKAGTKVKECVVEDCYINMSVLTAVCATSAFITVEASCLDFGNIFKNLVCNHFIQNGIGTILTTAIIAGANVGGNILLANCVFSGSTGVGIGVGTNIHSAAGGLAPVAKGGLSTLLTD